MTGVDSVLLIAFGGPERSEDIRPSAAMPAMRSRNVRRSSSRARRTIASSSS